MQIDLMQPADESEYEQMLHSGETTLFYHSLAWRNLLRRLVEGEDCYLVARHRGELVGALPAFLKQSPLGNVLNSLPFYGSNGGIVTSGQAKKPVEIQHALLDAFDALAQEKKAILATIITNPLEADVSVYETAFGATFRDWRIGQITRLPAAGHTIEDDLMAMIEPVRRRNIRKARKSGVRFRQSDALEDMQFLVEIHRAGIEAIGGAAKKWQFFRLVSETLEYGKEYRLYVAEISAQPIAGLLTFHFNRTVEYITPATVEAFRSLQPTSLLIFEAMKEAASEGYRFWNWGGTWPSQKSLYDFKKRWGTEDRPYHYFVRAYGDLSHILEMNQSALQAEYPYFYVVPYGELEDYGEKESDLSGR